MLCLIACQSVAQSVSPRMGARAQGMGNTSGCLSDVWSVINNVGGLSATDHISAGASFYAVPLSPHFSRTAAVCAVPLHTGVAGAAAFRFGDDLYNEHILSLAYANRFGLASLGIKVNYLQYRAVGIETRRALTMSFGGIASLTPELLFGAYMENINQPLINDDTGERVPARMTAGLAYKSSVKVIVAAEVHLDLAYTPTFRSGFEYRVFKKVAFRTGFNLNPVKGFFGAGFRSGKLDLDYSIQLYDPAGLSHQGTVVYQFRKK